MSPPSASDSDDQRLSQKTIRRMKLASDEKALALLEEQVQELLDMRTALEAQLANVHASLVLTQTSMDNAVMRRDALSLYVNEQRYALGALERFPDELLVQIFKAVAYEKFRARGPSPSSFQQARAPFLCAAICKRWRVAALGAPSLWCYIAIPQLTQAPSDGTRFLTYVEIALERSKSMGLFIIFDRIDHAGSLHHAKILELLARQIHRWEVFHATISEQRALPRFLDCLRGPAPLLEVVCICVRPGTNLELLSIDHEAPSGQFRPRYLSHAPRLRTLWMENLPFFWAHDHGVMPSMRHLTIVQRVLTDSFWTTVGAAATSLDALHVFASEMPPAPTAPIQLPLLDLLNIGFDAWKLFQQFPDAFLVPGLTSLAFSHSRLQPLDQFIRRLPSSVAYVTLSSTDIGEHDIPILYCLSSLTNLRLQDMTVTTLLFERLCESQDCMWPRLRKLELDEVDIAPANGNGLVHLVRTRASRGDLPQLQDVPPWSAIKSVSFDGNHNIPRWDVAEIKHLLAQN